MRTCYSVIRERDNRAEEDIYITRAARLRAAKLVEAADSAWGRAEAHAQDPLGWAAWAKSEALVLAAEDDPEMGMDYVAYVCTASADVYHPRLKYRTPTRVRFARTRGEFWRVWVESANTGNRILQYKTILIPSEELDALPDDPYDEGVFAKAALKLFGLNYE